MSAELALYHDLLTDIKGRVRQAQHKAALSANAEMILMYWDIGRMIAARQEQEGWGASVIPRLAVDLKNELPEEKGFSERNIKRMLRFYREYSEVTTKVPQAVALLQDVGNQASAIVPQPVAQLVTAAANPVLQQAVAQIPWGHNIALIEKIKDLPTRLWYAWQTLEHGWSRETLTVQIKNRAHERQGTAITNFSSTLPPVHASLASGLLKDPYLFDFLTLEEPFHERELETGLLVHIQKFLLELGQGFAFVGRQYRLAVSDRDFYLDLLFYHLNLRCFVVVDLKKGDFKPEHAGKMNFYCSVIDDQLRHPQDQPTLGLILCQTKDRILAEYALRDIHKPIGIADYEFTRALPTELASSLPSIEAIEAELSGDLESSEET
ncbi:MAG: PDDEXK nuclease domain-containing protein [Prosthecobacter sp.]|nr:PDDEXK nuclease domain-containing protein [Prosthecobacter sp.]